jgi:heat shock protein HslJ
MTLARIHVRPLLAAALLLAACAPKSPPETTTAPEEPAATAAPVALELGPTLSAYRWQLESAVDASGQSIAALFPGPENLLGLEFGSGRLGVTGGCNRINAGFQLVEVSKLQLGPATSTMMGCPPPLAAADQAIASFLSGTLQAELQGESSAPLLRLSAADGRVLDFKGTPTPETRFGGPGTRAFLEVSTEPCGPPHEAAPACLKVRDRYFDAQGLQSGEPGEWRTMPGGIEGYSPSPGQQQVVRVKRFEKAAASGGEPTVHFVFDMVVESRTVP